MIRFPPKKILVAFDYTEPAQHALEAGRALARRFDAALEVVYVEEPSLAFERPSPQEREETARSLRRRVGPGPIVKVLWGKASAKLTGLAKARRFDLLVMGTNGREGFARWRLGSVAETVVRHSPVPVLVVRRPLKALRSVLAPVNLTDYSQHGFVFAAGAAAACGAHLTVLHVDDKTIPVGNVKFALNGLLERLPGEVRKAVKPELELAEGDAVERIRSAARRHDLVALVAHRRGVVRDALLGTTAERVLRTSPAAVLTVPPPPRGIVERRWKSGEEVLAEQAWAPL